MRRRRGWVAWAGLLMLSAPSEGQQFVEPGSEREAPPSAEVAEPARPIDTDLWRTFRAAEAPGAAAESPEYRAAFEKAALESLAVQSAWEQLQLDYERKRLDLRARTFEWHRTSTVLIFVLVSLVVLSGLGLSFWHVLRQESAPTRIVIGDKGIELSSRLVGVLVFVLSLAFFYLYLHNVYPIVEVAPVKSAAAAPSGAGEAN